MCLMLHCYCFDQDEFFCIDGDNDDEAVMAANGGGKNGSSSSIKIVQKERWQDDDDGGSNKEATITYEFKGNGNQRKRHCIMVGLYANYLAMFVLAID